MAWLNGHVHISKWLVAGAWALRLKVSRAAMVFVAMCGNGAGILLRSEQLDPTA